MASEYRSKFEPYRDFFAENEALNIEQLLSEDHGKLNTHACMHHKAISQNTLCFVLDVDFFRKWLGRYRLEHIQCKNCPVEKDLGLLLVSTESLKSELLPSPLKCLNVSIHVIAYGDTIDFFL